MGDGEAGFGPAQVSYVAVNEDGEVVVDDFHSKYMG